MDFFLLIVGLAPVVIVGKEVHGKVKPTDIKKLIETYMEKERQENA